MNRKQELAALTFLTLFLVVMLASNIVNYILGSGSSILMIVCFAGGLICTVIAWVQYFRGKNRDNN